MGIEAVTDPAPPPCEACWYLTDSYGRGHTVVCWTQVAALHADIAELRARIKGMAVKYERQSKMNGSLSLVGAVRVAKELRAALATKEGT
jgi:hypothetical protein